MSEEADRRIEAAKQAAQREKETAEFLRGIKSGDDMIKPVRNPEAWIMRDKAAGAAKRGELPKTECTHPLQYIQQYVDDDPLLKRHGRPVNLFECGVCHHLLWFRDAYGEDVTDD